MPHFTPITRSLIVLSAAALAPLAFAQPDAPAAAAARNAADPNRIELKDPTNAALVYYQLWMRTDFEALKGPCGDQLQSGNALWRPDANLNKLLVEHRDAVDQLLRATRIPHADFGVEFSQGIKALLPNLGAMRASARILACDARRCIAEGDLNGACERIAAIYRMADHLSGAPVLISALVSVAVTSVANSQVQVLLTDGRMTVAGKQNLLDAARIMGKPDAFGVKRGLRAERWWSTDALRKLATGADAGRKVVGELAPLMDVAPDSPEGTRMAAMNEQQIGAEFDRASAAYDQLIAAWDFPDAEVRIGQIEQAIKAGDQGLIARYLIPALSNAHRADAKARAEHAAILDRLQKHVPMVR